MPFNDRFEAGQKLAKALSRKQQPAILALPRGGVRVAEGNSSRTPSPIVLTSRPPNERTIGVAASRRSRTALAFPASSSPMSRE